MTVATSMFPSEIAVAISRNDCLEEVAFDGDDEEADEDVDEDDGDGEKGF